MAEYSIVITSYYEVEDGTQQSGEIRIVTKDKAKLLAAAQEIINGID